MKKESGAIHHLIRQLSKAEKRLFTSSLKQNANSKVGMAMLRLADAIGAQTQYDEATLKLAFKPSETTKSFSELKFRLLQKVIGFIDEQESEKALYYKLEKRLRHADLLHDRGLPKIAWQKAYKVYQESLRYEQFDLAIRAITVLKRILLRHEMVHKYPKETNEFNADVKQHLKQLNVLHELNATYTELLSEFRKRGEVTTSEDRDAYAQIVDVDELLQQKYHGFRLESLQSIICSIYFNATHAKAEYFRQKQQYLRLYDKYPQFIRYNPREFAIGILNLIFACAESKKFDAGQNALVRFENYLDKHEAFESMRIYTYEFKLAYILHTRNFSEALPVIQLLEKKVDARDIPLEISMQQILCSLAVGILLFTGNYQYAKRWLLKLTNNRSLRMRSDYLQVLTVQELILEYELKHPNLLNSKLRELEESSEDKETPLMQIGTFLGARLSLMLKEKNSDKKRLIALADEIEQKWGGVEALNSMWDRFPLLDYLKK